MDRSLQETLVRLAREVITDDDPSHDFEHAQRVLGLSTRIALEEGADLEVVIPAALFHDAVNYPKNDPRASRASDESASLVGNLLRSIPQFPQEKIPLVEAGVRECSFSKGIIPKALESRILQDADRLEATGAIAIMRTFASTGRMSRLFYHPRDPFCENRRPDPLHYALDLFPVRLLKVEEMMHTSLGKKLAGRRTQFLRKFLEQLGIEIASAS